MSDAPDNTPQVSRLGRSHHARLRNRSEVVKFCDQNGIPYTLDFNELTQPDAQTKKEFADAYALEHLPPTTLPEKGASTVIVFETKVGKYQHGEMVSAVAERVGSNLEPGVEAIYVHAALNPHYRKAFEPKLLKPVNRLVENQGVAVIHTSIGWDDRNLGFEIGLDDQVDDLWKVTAFVVDSAGNHGRYGADGKLESPYQKHNAVSHAPPLVVHVGAAARNGDGSWHVEGYSAANSPTFLAPVAPDKKALWEPTAPPRGLNGTTIAAPYVSGVLAALNHRYGLYLTREQILYALIATCDRVDDVKPFGKNTPEPVRLDYITNANDLRYNPEYAGFGLINPHRADALLTQMVKLTQEKPESITVPVEERVRVIVPDLPPTRNEAGHCIYNIAMPGGIALKTTLDVEFSNAHGDVWLVSPSGTRLKLVMSKLDSKKYFFGISTTHGFAGEKLDGSWRIESTEPLRMLQLNQHHFMAQDIVASLDVPSLLKAPQPDLSKARRLTRLARDNFSWRGSRAVSLSGMSVGGEPPRFDSYETTAEQLKALPSAFAKRNRIYTPESHKVSDDYAGNEERAGDAAEPIQQRVEHYLRAAAAYKQSEYEAGQAACLAKAAKQLLRFIPPYTDNANIPAQQATPLLEEAIALQRQLGQLDLAYLNTCRLYTAHSKLMQHAATMDNRELKRQEGTAMFTIRGEARALWTTFLGGSDPGAHRIEEGEMGFSAKERIGTDNVNQCITVIARDPVTHKTGLVHLDHEADMRTLDSFFANFAHNRLEVRLIGAIRNGHAHSHANVTNIMRYMADKNVDIISADILGGDGGPSAIVVDPETFNVTEQVPAKATINAAVGNAVLLFTKQGKPLVTQFDFTRSPDRSPVFLSQMALQMIRERFLDRDEYELEQYFSFSKFVKSPFVNRPIVIDNLLTFLHAYNKEWDALQNTLDETIAQERVGQADAERARSALLNQRFFVGENARKANQPIHDWISNTLFADGKLQEDALDGVRLDDKPHRMSFAGRLTHEPAGISCPG